MMAPRVTLLVEEIGELVDEMREITLAAGVPVATYDRSVEVHADLTIEDLEARLQFLKEVRAGAYREVIKVWRLLSPTIWARYEAFGESQLREQRLLKEARKQLRRTWRKRYGEKVAPEQGLDPDGLDGEPVRPA